MKRLKIVHICLSDKWSGSEVAAAEFANGLSPTHDVSVIFVAGKDIPATFYRDRLKESVRFHLLSDPGSMRDLRKAAIRLTGGIPDIVHGHLGPACRALPKAFPDVITIGHLHIRFFSKQHGNLDGVIAIAPWQLGDVPQHYSGNAWLVPNFLQDAQFMPRFEMRERLLRMLHLSPSAKLVGTMGRLHGDKGIDVLIEAQRFNGDQNTHLLLFGEGTEELQLRKRAAGLRNVHFMGFRHDALQLCGGLDLYISAARTEPFGLATLEAMAAGVSVISTRTKGSEWLLEHLPDRLFDIEDVRGTAAAIKEFCSLGHVVPDYCLERFDRQTSITALEAAYREALVSPNSQRRKRGRWSLNHFMF